MHPDELIARLATRQYGLVTYRQLRGLGLGEGAIRSRARSGALRRLDHAVYAVGHEALSEEGRMLCAVMACGPRSWLSHTHAAKLWGVLAPWQEPDRKAVHVTVVTGSGRGRRRAVHRHRSRSVEGTTHRAIPVTRPARTVLDVAAIAGHRIAEDTVDRALNAELTTVAQLRNIVDAHRGSRGAGRLRRVLDENERYDVSDSALELKFLELVLAADLPRPRRNARIAGLRVDAVWEPERVAVELDGYRWHRTRSRSEADRQRDLRLRALGYLVLRYSARQVFEEPLMVIGDLAGALRNAGDRRRSA